MFRVGQKVLVKTLNGGAVFGIITKVAANDMYWVSIIGSSESVPRHANELKDLGSE